MADLQAKLDKTRLVAPVDGVVGVLVAEQGEVVPVGKPVLTLESGTPWFAFTLREDDAGAIDGRQRRRRSRPSGGRHIAARVTELRPLGEFATWRAARAVGDHDLNSFRLRLDPVAADRRAAAGHDSVAGQRFIGPTADMHDELIRELIADPFVQTGVLAVVGALITRILLRKYPAMAPGLPARRSSWR